MVFCAKKREKSYIQFVDDVHDVFVISFLIKLSNPSLPNILIKRIFRKDF